MVFDHILRALQLLFLELVPAATALGCIYATECIVLYNVSCWQHTVDLNLNAQSRNINHVAVDLSRPECSATTSWQ